MLGLSTKVSTMAVVVTIELCLLFLLGCVHGHANRPSFGKKTVSAFYVFGDASVDVGNNNFLDTDAKANFAPYGVDFSGSPIKGRFTNGRTFADFIVEYLGLPLPPPYLSFKNDNERSAASVTGINYGSGGCGTFHDPATAAGDCMTMDDQLRHFKETVESDLPKQIKDQNDLKKHLADSIAVVSFMNGDDYDNHVAKASVRLGFVTLFFENFSHVILKLYKLGLRKFVIPGMDDLGCQLRHKIPNQGKCQENLSALSKEHNFILRDVLNLLANLTHGSIYFSQLDVYSFIQDVGTNPTKYGLSKNTNTNDPCCKVDAHFRCVKDSDPCKNRKEHILFDGMNPTEAIHELLAKHCIDGSICTSRSIKQLVAAKAPTTTEQFSKDIDRHLEL